MLIGLYVSIERRVLLMSRSSQLGHALRTGLEEPCADRADWEPRQEL